MSRRFRSSILIFLGVPLVLAGVMVLTRGVWLPWLGEALVHDDGPGKAELAIVLAGDHYGHRMEKGAELVRAGDVPAVQVDGPPGFYGIPESDLAINFIVREGYPKEWFIPFPMTALSTKEEADQDVVELERRHIQSFLLVTSNYHTARAARIFRTAMRRHGARFDMRVVASRDEFFDPETWWHNREAQKIVFNEWTKNIAGAFGF